MPISAESLDTMTQQTELLRTAIDVLDKAASTLFVQIKASTDEEMVLLLASRTRWTTNCRKASPKSSLKTP